MTTKEKSLLNDLEEVCEHAVMYVGSANYNSRELLALANVRKAMSDFSQGIKPEWDENLCPDDY